MLRVVALAACSAFFACSTQSAAPIGEASSAPGNTQATAIASSAAPPPASTVAARKFGAPIGASEFATLSDIARDPSAYAKKKVKTEGTVTAVCQHMGCWMEIESDNKEAHVKMAGHEFFVPKNLSGRRAIVEGDVTTDAKAGACGDAHEGGDDCGGAAKAAGAKVEIEATGVELVD